MIKYVAILDAWVVHEERICVRKCDGGGFATGDRGMKPNQSRSIVFIRCINE